MGTSAEPPGPPPVLPCLSCGEGYDSRERIQEALRNAGYCVNRPCLADLRHLPLGALLRRAPSRRRDAGRDAG